MPSSRQGLNTVFTSVEHDGQPNSTVTNSPSGPESATRQLEEHRIRGAAKPRETRRPARSPTMESDAIMASPVEISRRSSRFGPAEKSTMTPASSSSLDSELKGALYQYKSSAVDLATIQHQYNTLTHDEQEQTKERARWSKYSDSFPAIREDQARNLKVIERARKQSQIQIDQAKQEGENAINTIARIIFTTSIGSRAPESADTAATIGPSVNKHSEEVIGLKEQITSLKRELSHCQASHEREIADLRKELLRSIGVTANESVRINKLTDLAAEQESIKARLDKLSANKMDNIKVELESKLDKQSASMSQSLKAEIINELQPRLKAEIINELQPRLTESIKACYKPELEKLNGSVTTQITANLESQLKELDCLKSAMSTSDSAIATMKSEVSELSESIYTVVEYHKAIKDPFQTMVRESKARDQTVKQIAGQQDTQGSALQLLNDKISEIQDTLNGYEHLRSLGEDNKSRIENYKEELSTEQRSLRAQLDELHERQQASLVMVSRTDCQTPNTISEGEAAPLERLNRIDEHIKKLHSTLEAKEKVETDRDEAISKEIGQVWDSFLQLEKDIKKLAEESAEKESLGSTSLEQVVHDVKKLSHDHLDQAEKCAQLCTAMEQLATDVKTLSGTVNGRAENWSNLNGAVTLPNEARQQLDQLCSDQSSTSAALEQMKADMERLNASLSSMSDMSVPQNRPYQNTPTPPQTNNEDEVQPKIEALESKVDYFEMQINDKVKAMEYTLSSHGSRFNNMTTEPLIMSVVHTLQQLYPLQTLQINQNCLKQELSALKQELSLVLSLVQKQGETDGTVKQGFLDLQQETHNLKQEIHSLTTHQDLATQYPKPGILEIKKDLFNLTSKFDQLAQKSQVEEDIHKLVEKADTQAKHQTRSLEELQHNLHEFQASVVASRGTIEQDLSALKEKIETLERGSQGQAGRDVEELGQKFCDFEKTVTICKETIEQQLSGLKDSVESQADNQRRLEEKLNTQCQSYMEEAVDYVKKIDIRVEDLEKVSADVGKDVVGIQSDSDQGPVKMIPKRSTEAFRDGSLDRPRQKRKLAHLDDNSDSHWSEQSQQTASPSSRIKRGRRRPSRMRAD
ncbi:MAG: hypothetical protein L6R36_003999 [Xanthoria steineri]|nr:MAG: hypothetical protein L6R36_003999 [Xanthoria steineri]